MKKKAWPQRDPEPPFESSRHSKPVFWLSVSVLNVIYVFCIVYVVLLLCVSELYSPSAGFECAENGQWLCIIINILVVHSYSQLSSLLRYINWQVPSHTHTHTHIHKVYSNRLATAEWALQETLYNDMIISICGSYQSEWLWRTHLTKQ